MKKSILTTLLFAVLYFLCMGIGVLLGNLFDQTGNMFYAPAFTALVGGSVYMILVAKIPRFGAITTIGLVIALFFLGTKHGAGAFLPGILAYVDYSQSLYGYSSGKRKIARIYRPYHGRTKPWNCPSIYRKYCHRSPSGCLDWTSLE